MSNNLSPEAVALFLATAFGLSGNQGLSMDGCNPRKSRKSKDQHSNADNNNKMIENSRENIAVQTRIKQPGQQNFNRTTNKAPR